MHYLQLSSICFHSHKMQVVTKNVQYKQITGIHKELVLYVLSLTVGVRYVQCNSVCKFGNKMVVEWYDYDPMMVQLHVGPSESLCRMGHLR